MEKVAGSNPVMLIARLLVAVSFAGTQSKTATYGIWYSGNIGVLDTSVLSSILSIPILDHWKISPNACAIYVKVCSKCGQREALAKFAWCAACRKEYDAARYRSKRELRCAQIKAHIRAVQQEIAAIKEATPCVDCGFSFPACAMSFDHLPGTGKVANISDLAKNGCRTQALREIEKCELVCLNCHAIRTDSRYLRVV